METSCVWLLIRISPPNTVIYQLPGTSCHHEFLPGFACYALWSFKKKPELPHCQNRQTKQSSLFPHTWVPIPWRGCCVPGVKEFPSTSIARMARRLAFPHGWLEQESTLGTERRKAVKIWGGTGPSQGCEDRDFSRFFQTPGVGGDKAYALK